MGNVQSGKTESYIGLMHKSVLDCGYQVFIILGGHQEDLRKQTQIRIDDVNKKRGREICGADYRTKRLRKARS